MMTDEEVTRRVNHILSMHHKEIKPGTVFPTQVFRGISAYGWENQHPAACDRHKKVFDRYNAIPKYCFNCFKVSVKPRNVIELLKVFFVFDKLKLPNNNTRKCHVECRDDVTGTYTGLVYCMSIDEALNVFNEIESIVKAEISNEISVFLKRGCSEYEIAYPGYANVIQGQTSMEYNEEWVKYEEIIDKDYIVDASHTTHDSHNEKTFTLQDAKVVLAFLKYAATIDDLSYLKITDGRLVQPFANINRPSFQSASL